MQVLPTKSAWVACLIRDGPTRLTCVAKEQQVCRSKKQGQTAREAGFNAAIGCLLFALQPAGSLRHQRIYLRRRYFPPHSRRCENARHELFPVRSRSTHRVKFFFTSLLLVKFRRVTSFLRLDQPSSLRLAARDIFSSSTWEPVKSRFSCADEAERSPHRR